VSSVCFAKDQFLQSAIFLPTRHAPVVQLALSLSLHFLQNNFVRVFKLASQLLPLGKCALFPHINLIRRQALQTLCTAYSSRNAHFPLRVLCQWLLWDDLRMASEFCRAYGLEVSGDCVLFRRGAFSSPPDTQVKSVASICSILPQCSDYSSSQHIQLQGTSSLFTIAGLATNGSEVQDEQDTLSDLILGLK